jgi:hypothetical protein
LAEVANFALTSDIYFDKHSAYMSVDISNRDYEFFSATQFPDDKMDFMAVILVAGSDV